MGGPSGIGPSWNELTTVNWVIDSVVTTQNPLRIYTYSTSVRFGTVR